MTKILRATTLGIALIALHTIAFSQTELGLMAGVSGYDGDLGPTSVGTTFARLKPAVGAYARMPLSDRLGFVANVQHYSIEGSDSDRPSSVTRNLSFSSKVMEFGAAAEVYPLGMDRPLAPYLTVGAAVYRFNPETEFNGRQVELQPLGTEGQGLPGYGERYGLTRFAIPVGVGIRVPIGDAWVAGAQLRARLLLFDHLDDVSGNYVNYYELVQGNGSLSAALADRTGEYLGIENRDIPSGTSRGDATDDDVTYTASLTIGYRLGTGLFSGGSRGSGGSRYGKCYQF